MFPLPKTSRGLQPREVVAPHVGDKGWPVYALQKALDELHGYALAADGVFGPATTREVKAFQGDAGLTADGRPGPVTQRAIAAAHVKLVDTGLPKGLLDGFAEMEGGWLLAAVNDSTPGGTDCGIVQRRVYAADYDDAEVVGRAFDTHYQFDALAKSLRDLRATYSARAGTRDAYGGVKASEKAWRLAALNHNYPAASERLSLTPVAQLPSTWTSPADWVTSVGYAFPDGVKLRSPLDWAHHYAGVLGRGVHSDLGLVTRFVQW